MWFIALERRNPLKEWATYPSSEGTLSKPRYNVLLSFPVVVRSCGSLSCNVCGTLREVYAFTRRIRGSSWMETSFFLTNYVEEQFWGAFRWVEIVLELYIVYSLHDVNCLWKGFKSCLEMIPELSILLRILKTCQLSFMKFAICVC